MRRPGSPPTASSNERVAPRTASPQTKATKKKKRENNQDRPRRRSRPRQTEKTDLALCVPLYLSWLIAPPSFQLPREASRRRAFFRLNRGHLFSFSRASFLSSSCTFPTFYRASFLPSSCSFPTFYRASFLPNSCSFPTFYRVRRSFSLDECQASGSHR